MPSWKKVVISGSQAELAAVSASIALRVGTNQQITSTQSTTFLTGSFTGSFTGPLTGTASFATNAANSTSASRAITAASSDVSYAVQVISTPAAVNTWYIPQVYSSGSFENLSVTSSLVYTPATQLLTATASRAVSASWAGVASSSYVTSSDATSTENHYLTFVKQTGNTGLSALSGSYNSYFDVYISPQSGYNYLYNVTSLGEHWGAVKSYDAVDNDNKDYNVLFASTQSAVSELLKDSSGSYRYNPTRKTLIVTNVSASSVTTRTVSASAVTASATLIGTSSAQAFTTTIQQSNLGPGNFTIVLAPTVLYDSVYFKYALKSGSDARQAGEVFGIRSGSTVLPGQYSSLANFDTNANRIRIGISSGNFVLTGSFSSGSWEVKGIVQVI